MTLRHAMLAALEDGYLRLLMCAARIDHWFTGEPWPYDRIMDIRWRQWQVRQAINEFREGL